MHEDVDSFGGIPYYGGGKGRIINNNVAPEVGLACQMGCDAAPWTGSLVVKQSTITDAIANGEAPSGSHPAIRHGGGIQPSDTGGASSHQMTGSHLAIGWEPCLAIRCR